MIDATAQLLMLALGVLAATPEWRSVYPMLTNNNVERLEAEEKRWMDRLSRLQ